jgi:hypothetical protein
MPFGFILIIAMTVMLIVGLSQDDDPSVPVGSWRNGSVTGSNSEVSRRLRLRLGAIYVVCVLRRAEGTYFPWFHSPARCLLRRSP